MNAIKNRIQIVAAILVLLVTACEDKNSGNGSTDNRELVFSPSVGEQVDFSSRGYGNTFFDAGDQVRVTIQTSRGGSTEDYIYTYSTLGILQGNPGFYFPLDDTYIETLTATWPADTLSIGSFASDQREYDNYRKSDWLVAQADLSGVMPTDVPVPLLFNHNNALLEFELVGQNAAGLNISELVLQLEVEGTPTACWAYCGNENGRAALIVRAGTEIESREGYLIGTISGSSEEQYSIILPELDFTLEAGYKYLITLTPRGYDLDVYVEIGGWTENKDTGIGVPFHNPTEGEDGDYIIQTAVQLITMSYVIRHYTNGSTIQWPALTYVLADDFTMEAEYAELYIPIPVSLFTGQIIYRDEPITTISYGDGAVLELFTNDN